MTWRSYQAATACGAFALALCACPVLPPEPVEPEPVVVPPPLERATCVDACVHLAELGCEEARPTPAGVPCADVCAASPLDPPCMASVVRCEQLTECWR